MAHEAPTSERSSTRLISRRTCRAHDHVGFGSGGQRWPELDEGLGQVQRVRRRREQRSEHRSEHLGGQIRQRREHRVGEGVFHPVARKRRGRVDLAVHLSLHPDPLPTTSTGLTGQTIGRRRPRPLRSRSYSR